MTEQCELCELKVPMITCAMCGREQHLFDVDLCDPCDHVYHDLMNIAENYDNATSVKVFAYMAKQKLAD